MHFYQNIFRVTALLGTPVPHMFLNIIVVFVVAQNQLKKEG